jgi:hypothetical protein
VDPETKKGFVLQCELKHIHDLHAKSMGVVKAFMPFVASSSRCKLLLGKEYYRSKQLLAYHSSNGCGKN